LHVCIVADDGTETGNGSLWATSAAFT